MHADLISPNDELQQTDKCKEVCVSIYYSDIGIIYCA